MGKGLREQLCCGAIRRCHNKKHHQVQKRPAFSCLHEKRRFFYFWNKKLVKISPLMGGNLPVDFSKNGTIVESGSVSIVSKKRYSHDKYELAGSCETRGNTFSQ